MTKKRISDLVPAEDVISKWYKPAELEGVDLEISGFEERSGNYGDYVVIKAKRVATGEEIEIATGSETVMEQLAVVKEAKAFPIVGCFKRSGRRWILE